MKSKSTTPTSSEQDNARLGEVIKLGVDAERRFQGSITKHGNPRLRHLLIECVWLLMHWNSGYVGIVKWRDKLDQTKLTSSSKKKIAVALARQLAVDLWRLRTGQVTAKELGLTMKEEREMIA